MIKRIVIFALCLIFSVSVFVSAQSAGDSPEQPTSGQENMAPPQGGGGRMGRGPGGGMGRGRGGMQPPEMENADAAQPSEMPAASGEAAAAGGESGNMQSPGLPEENGNIQPPEMSGGRGMGGFSGDMQGQISDVGMNRQGAASAVTGFVKEYSTPVISLVLLIIAFVFVKFYKRKTY